MHPPLRRRIRAAQRRRPAARRPGTRPRLRKRLALVHGYWHLTRNHIGQKTRVSERAKSASRLSGSPPASAVRGTRAGLLLPCSRHLICQGRNRSGLHPDLDLLSRGRSRSCLSGPSNLEPPRRRTWAEDGDGQLTSAGSPAHASASLQMQQVVSVRSF